MVALASGCILRLPLLKQALQKCGFQCDIRTSSKRGKDNGYKKGKSQGTDVAYKQATMLYDLVYNGKVTGGGELKRSLMAKKDLLREKCAQIETEMRQRGTWEENSKTAQILPRYLRVDLTRWSREEALCSLRNALGIDDHFIAKNFAQKEQAVATLDPSTLR